MFTSKEAIEVESAAKAILRLKDGREIIDAISSWWVITHGHCEPRIVEAIAKQASQLDQILFANFTNNPAEKLVEKLSCQLPEDLNKFFFSDNGSTSVEVALKMLIQYWQHLGEKQRKVFISFNNSYHGDTVGAMSVSGDDCFSDAYKDMLFRVHKVAQGQYSFDSVEDYTHDFLDTFEKHKNSIAGIIIEPLVQGAGGMIQWPIEVLEIIGQTAHSAGVPIIFDEVMTGFGRTGSLFAFQQLSYSPDVICLSKGLTAGNLPLSLTVAKDHIYKEFLSQDKGKMFFHGHSFTGNPISCASAVANLEIIESTDMKSKWDKINKIHRERLERFVGPKVYDRRLCGTIAAVELKDENKGYISSLTKNFTDFALDRDVFLRPLGNVLYVLPPYSINDYQLQKTCDVIEEYCEQLN
ncbi:MAG: adenosylmethionine--8-amino-7-oxononanoate transaminase [Bdellovibrionales bacterium]|nr:adenosylmethionine--8-amino-7-oxononanoate transaminase [Bdellovibrionales bacterium]